MLEQKGYVLPALSQGRSVNADDVQSVKKVSALRSA